MRSCIYCGSVILVKRFFCNLKCKDKFLLTDYKTHPINNESKSVTYL